MSSVNGRQMTPIDEHHQDANRHFGVFINVNWRQNMTSICA